MRAPALLLTLVAGSVAAGAASAEPRPGEAAVAPLRREVAQLRRERELSARKDFYLRLDAARQRLALMLQGVTLDEYAVSGLELGVPEVLFVDRRPRADWDTEPISKGRLDPERQQDRVEFIAPAPVADEAQAASPSPPPIPLSAEESYSVPSPYRVVFSGGVSLEVRAEGVGRRNRSLPRRLVDALGLRLSDLASALGVGSRDRIRLRVTLEAEDAASLYRSLPPDVSLVVIGLPPR